MIQTDLVMFDGVDVKPGVDNESWYEFKDRYLFHCYMCGTFFRTR